MDYFNYSRRQSNEVYVGATPMGGANPIRIQSMTNTVTMDTEACIEQAKRIIDAGGEYVRLTTQGVREAENLKNINALRITFSVNNVATITNYSGLSPMINSATVGSDLGIDDKRFYPLTRTYSLGLSLNF